MKVYNTHRPSQAPSPLRIAALALSQVCYWHVGAGIIALSSVVQAARKVRGGRS